MSKVYVIGGANLDIFAKSEKELIIKDSNPSKISFAKGGVARNIVENLANFKVPTTFVTALGSDAFGKDIKESLEKKGVDFSYAITSKDKTTSVYLAILNKDDMYLGASDMSVLDELTPAYLSKLKDVIKEDDYLIFDTNLNVENIEFIANELKGIKIVDAISASKVTKLKTVLNKLSILKVNKLELETIANTKDIKEGINYLLNEGVKQVLTTDSCDLYIGEKTGISTYKHYAYNPNPVNVTGAGDSLLASYVYGLINNLSEEERVKFSLTTAVLTIEVNQAVRDLSVEEVNNKIIRIEKL